MSGYLRRSSAGNTRGLIEAVEPDEYRGRAECSLPRGIPAASLKLLTGPILVAPSQSLPRGIPAASLKQNLKFHLLVVSTRSSAGNTRGLIEAPLTSTGTASPTCLPRGIPAASLKPRSRRMDHQRDGGLPRGIPAASLKRRCPAASAQRPSVFRGEYPRPH